MSKTMKVLLVLEALMYPAFLLVQSPGEIDMTFCRIAQYAVGVYCGFGIARSADRAGRG